MKHLSDEQLLDEIRKGRDPAYHMTLAREADTWTLVHAELKLATDCIGSGSVGNEVRQGRAENLLRFCQISCAHGSDIQDLAVSADIHSAILQYAQYNPGLAFSALSNLITKNVSVANLVLREVLKEEDTFLTDTNITNVSTRVLLFLRNAIAFVQDDKHKSNCFLVAQCAILRQELCRKTALERKLFSVEDENDEAMRFDLMVAIMDTLLDAGALTILMSAHQTVLDDEVSKINVRNDVYRYVEQYCYLAKVTDGAEFSSILIIELSRCVRELESSLATGVAKEIQHANWIGVSLLISALASIITTESGERLLALPTVQSCVPDLIKALGLAHQHFPRAKGGREGSQKESQTDEGAVRLPNLKRDCVSLISNISHQNRHVQDQVRELGGVPLILEQCNIDDLNPFLREHAMYCIRNLLDNNPENQALVDSIKPVGVEQTSELGELGYSAALEGDKVKISQTAKIHSINDDDEEELGEVKDKV